MTSLKIPDGTRCRIPAGTRCIVLPDDDRSPGTLVSASSEDHIGVVRTMLDPKWVSIATTHDGEDVVVHVKVKDVEVLE